MIPCLLQFYIASEETKFGLDMEEAKALLESNDYKQMKNDEDRGRDGDGDEHG